MIWLTLVKSLFVWNAAKGLPFTQKKWSSYSTLLSPTCLRSSWSSCGCSPSCPLPSGHSLQCLQTPQACSPLQAFPQSCSYCQYPPPTWLAWLIPSPPSILCTNATSGRTTLLKIPTSHAWYFWCSFALVFFFGHSTYYFLTYYWIQFVYLTVSLSLLECQLLESRDVWLFCTLIYLKCVWHSDH